MPYPCPIGGAFLCILFLLLHQKRFKYKQKMEKNRLTDSQTAQIARVMAINTKPILSFEEAASFLDCSKSFLYKLTAQKIVPFYRPSGKMIFFERVELENWVKSNRVATEQELQDKAQHLANKKGGRL